MRPFDVVAAGMLAAAIALGSNAVLAEPLQRKPNIVVIMTDDAGWEDLVCVSNTPRRKVSEGTLAADSSFRVGFKSCRLDRPHIPILPPN
jgi:hypothetical protein